MQKTFFIDTDNIEIKSGSVGKTLKIAGYANTTDKDRAGDIVKAEAWAKGVDNFRKNPILLYQHDHSKPIGKVNSITVDNKGIYVEASISNAAEAAHGVQTLIKDGVLKSFSVGFSVKDADYDRGSDTFIITSVDLLEISVVSVPANQNSLFSIKKGFEDNESYNEFKKQFVKEVLEVQEPEEKIITEEIKTASEEGKEEETLEMTANDDPYKPIPFVNLLNIDTSKITEKTIVVIDGDRYKTVEIATAEKPDFTFVKVDVAGNESDTFKKVPANNITVLNAWDLDTAYDIHLHLETEEKSTVTYEDFKKYVNSSEFDLIKLRGSAVLSNNTKLQRILNDSYNLVSLSEKEWNSAHYQLAAKMCSVVSKLLDLPEDYQRDLLLNVYGHNIQNTLEEKNQMTTQNVGEPIVINTGAAEKVDTKTATASVAEPRVAQLVEQTGKAILAAEAAEHVAKETGKATDPRVFEELAELKGQLQAYKEQVNTMTTSKMHYQESTRIGEQFTASEKANAVFLAKALGKGAFDTAYGSRMKAVLTDNHLNEAFSTNVYNEMQQSLIIAPMFRRIEVPVKDFRIPVADEDTSDYVAQFPSGTFATGDTDSTNVPTSRQAQIGSVLVQPGKFMVQTHIAKDEQEDTIIPLVDFLRQAATNRLARGIDKAILRGDGTLSAFSASNALTTSYPSIIKGVVELAASVGGLVTKTSATNDKADPSDLAAARLLLGRYGLVAGGQLAYVTSIEGYNNLVTNTDFQTVDKFGAQATYLTGSVGAIYGIPIYVSEFMDTASAADANLGVLIYKPGFIIGERRAMELESEYLPKQQVTAMYLSTRIDFKALTTVSGAALSTRYSFASLVTSAS